jgi:hypothetical protein
MQSVNTERSLVLIVLHRSRWWASFVEALHVSYTPTGRINHSLGIVLDD